MISIVIPNYNGVDLLKKNIPFVVDACLYFQEKMSLPTEIIIVDDKSTDNSIDFLREFTQKHSSKKYVISAQIISRVQNGGFSKAMNSGIAVAQYDYIFSLNSDVLIPKECLYELIIPFQGKSNIFATKPKSVLPDGTNESVKNIQWRRGLLEPIIGDPQGYNEKIGLLYPDAGSCLYDRKKLIQLGGFDEIFSPFYFEDFDLGLKSLVKGWKTLYVPQITVLHEHNQTVKKVVTRLDKNEVFVRNREIFNTRYVSGFICKTQQIFWKILRLGKALITGNATLAHGVWSSYLHTREFYSLRTQKPTRDTNTLSISFLCKHWGK